MIFDFAVISVRVKFIVIKCLLLLISLGSFSQERLMQFKHLTAENGLSSSNVLCALQDYKGFMWIGTSEGLNRYDGSNFKEYKNVKSDSSALPYNQVRTIFEDSHNNLYIGTSDGGLSLYDRNLDKFINYIYEKSSPLYKMSFSLLKIAEDSYGRLWLATNIGLICFDKGKNTVVQYRNNPENHGSISDNDIRYVYCDKKGRLWISTTKGLDLYKDESDYFEHIKHCSTHNKEEESLYFMDIIEDKEGNIWAGSFSGLYCIENKNSTPELTHYTCSMPGKDNYSLNINETVFIDREDNLWLSTENAGIILFDKNLKRYVNFSIDEFNPMSLNNSSIWAITQDRNDNLWFCTYGGGVNILTPNSDFIVHYKNIPGANQSLSFNIVTCFYEDSKGQKWVGTDGGGVNIFNEKTGRFVRFNNENSNLHRNTVLCFEETGNGKIWMGTWGGGLACYDDKHKSFESYSKINSKIPDSYIFTMAKDQQNNLWMGGLSSGLIKYDIDKNEFIKYTPLNSDIKNVQINVVRTDKKGRIYVGTSRGFQIFNSNENRFLSYNYIPSDIHSLSDSLVTDIFVEEEEVWIGTQNGLNRFDFKTNKFERFFMENGLPDNRISGITTDKEGILWITTKSGICRFDYNKKEFRNYSSSDGIQGNEFYPRSILRTKDGTILAGGINGFNLITPERMPENKTIPNVILTGFQIFNNEVVPGIKDSPLKRQISETTQLRISYSQSVLTFSFSVLDFTNPQKNQYAYKMESFDNDWIYSGTRKQTTYTNLNPGKYIFRVKGCNNNGVWNETGTTLEITITPPWWKTWVATLGFSLLLGFTVFSFYLWRINKLKEQKRLLEKLVEERTYEINQKSKLLELQAENLNNANSLLVEHQEEIIRQNEELERHRNHLEQMVEERTSELVKAKIKAEESDRLKTSFLANLSHELRTPMNAIYGFSQLLDEEEISKEEKSIYIKIIADNCESLLILVNDIMDISRIETEDIVLIKEKFSIDDLLKELEKNYKKSNQKDLIIEFSNSSVNNNIILFNDKLRLRQVFINLLDNAYKFTEAGNIKFGYNISDGNISFYVSDTGIGIESSEFENIFNHFYKIEKNPNKLFRGTGLGLAISKKVIEKMGGDIQIESTLGKGSSFIFTIPITSKYS